MITRDEVIAALDRVLDPELHRSIVALGMVGTVEVDGSRVAITIKLTVAGCPLKAEIQRRVSEAVAVLPGVEGVQVGLDTMTDAERAGVRDSIIGGPRKDSPFGADSRTTVILVASGKGGVGKSSVTCNLAVAMAEAGYSVGLLDADVYGYSVPRMMGADRQPVMMDDLIIPVESHGVRLMSIGFMTADDNPVIWRGPMLHKALTSFVTEVFWDDPDVLLVDLPPGTGDVSLSLAGLLPAAHVVVVTTPQLTAQRVARRAAALGYEGKWAIHPTQIEIANTVFSPSEKEIAYAKRIMEAMAEAQREGRGAVSMDGRLIDIASIKMAENLLRKIT